MQCPTHNYISIMQTGTGETILDRIWSKHNSVISIDIYCCYILTFPRNSGNQYPQYDELLITPRLRQHSSSPSSWFVTGNCNSEIMTDDLCREHLVSCCSELRPTTSHQPSQANVRHLSRPWQGPGCLAPLLLLGRPGCNYPKIPPPPLSRLELQSKVCEDFTIKEKAPTWAFSWLKALSHAKLVTMLNWSGLSVIMKSSRTSVSGSSHKIVLTKISILHCTITLNYSCTLGFYGLHFTET